MRKLFASFIVISLLLAIAGCKKEATTSAESTIPQTTAPQEMIEATEPTTPQIDSAPTQKPMYAISLVSKTDDTLDGAGKLRFQYTYQSMSLILPEPAVADRILLDYLNRMDQMDQYAETLRKDSLIDEHNPYSHTYIHQIQYEPMRFDDSVLSLCADQTIYTGGIHPHHISHAITYDLLTGNALKLPDVLNSNIDSATIINMIISKLNNSDELWPDYKDIINDSLGNNLDTAEIWYLSGDGLCFRFDPYVLAPYAAGHITVTLPYSDLTGILRNEYFPAEEDNHQGALSAETFSTDALGKFSQFAELVTVNDGTKILLSANGEICDITVQIEDKNGESNGFSEKTILAVQTLSSKDALLVEFDPGKSNILVTYRNGDKYETKTVTCNDNTITIS